VDPTDRLPDSTQEEAPPPSVTTQLRGIRRTTARRMGQAWAAPVFHLVREVDMSRAVAPGSRPAGVTVTDVILAASAAALARHPALNAHYADEAVTVFRRVHLGLAVAAPAGLVVPVIHEADGLSLEEIAARRRNLVERARGGLLRMEDVDGGTFTISNLGMFDIDRFDAILNLPQVAILAVGGTRDRFVRVGDHGEWRPVAELTLTCDHRAVDGADAARFLDTLRHALEDGAV
jgi:pyruvate dehydrogenase E2 component (dihydrolipoamide acetyltransferase)